MRPLKAVKAGTTGVWILGMLLWATSSSSSTSTLTDQARTPSKTTQKHDAGDYVGSEACQTCHEAEFKNFSHTKHAHLGNLAGWRGKVTGCEQCHGPGRAHVESDGDPTKIISFKNKPAKEISETCLICHAGREEHNNFRRGEHWRNDVGCTDCHSSHSPDPGPTRPASLTLVDENRRNPNSITVSAMLKESDPQLCLKCHTEMKAQFHLPFRHKVLEGTMKCSDCHNPHGGFELKQTRLSTGADAPCLKCHVNKQGPFVFEHAPIKVEGCTVCHTPHGSSSPRLLVRSQVRQVCLECHSNAHEIGAPDTPSFHNQATVRFQNCTTCHAKIHGSQVDRFFFR